jgi:hypothetical protein
MKRFLKYIITTILFGVALAVPVFASTTILKVYGGGTGIGSVSAGAILYGSSTPTSTLSTLNIGTVGTVLQSNGSNPQWVATSTLGFVGGSSITLNGLTGSSFIIATSTGTNNYYISTSTNTITINLPQNLINYIATTSTSGLFYISTSTLGSGNSLNINYPNNVINYGNLFGTTNRFAFFSGQNTATSSPNVTWTTTGYNTFQLTGTTTISNLLLVGSTTLGSLFTAGQTQIGIAASSTLNNFNEVNYGCRNNGSLASVDYVLTSDIGSSSTYYSDLFQNCSGFSKTSAYSGIANDSGLLNSDASLYLGTSSSTNSNANLYLIGQGTNIATGTKTGLTVLNATTSSFTITGLLGQNCLGTNGAGVLQAGSCGGSGNSAWTIGIGKIYNATSTDMVIVGGSATTSNTTLTVVGTATNNLFQINSSSNATLLRVNPNGSLAIGTTTSASLFMLQGTSTLPSLPLFTIASSSGANYLNIFADGGMAYATTTDATTTAIYAGQYYSAFYDNGTTTATTTIDWGRGNTQRLGLNTSTAVGILFANQKAGARYILMLQQASSTGQTVNWPSAAVWAGGTAPTLTSGTYGKIDIITFVCGPYSNDCYGAANTNFSP